MLSPRASCLQKAIPRSHPPNFSNSSFAKGVGFAAPAAEAIVGYNPLPPAPPRFDFLLPFDGRRFFFSLALGLATWGYWEFLINRCDIVMSN